MKRVRAAGLAILLASLAWPVHAAGTPKRTLTAFRDEADLQAFFKRYGEAKRARQPLAPAGADDVTVLFGNLYVVGAPSAVRLEPPGPAAGDLRAPVPDESGVVKAYGRHVVILQAGRLFSVDTADGGLRQVSSVPAHAPDTDPSRSDFDEMAIAGDTVAVIGRNIPRGGVEIGLFAIDQAGRLSYRATYHLSYNFPRRHNVSHQVGSKLIFYTPAQIRSWTPGGRNAMPSMRKWHPADAEPDFVRTAPATSIYRIDEPLDLDGQLVLHTITVCNLAAPEMACKASAVLGLWGRQLYVSATAAYVWADLSHIGNDAKGKRIALFRIPLDGGAPSAAQVGGSPVDRHSFLEGPGGRLNVLLRAPFAGRAPWPTKPGYGEVALLRLAPGQFADGRQRAPASSYAPLPGYRADDLTNRYVGPWLLYGSSGVLRDRKGSTAPPPLRALPWSGKGPLREIALEHWADRVEALADGAVAIGSKGKDLYFTHLRLEQRQAAVSRYIKPNAGLSHSYSDGIYGSEPAAREALLGVPIVAAPANPDEANGSARTVLYLRSSPRGLDALGTLELGAAPARDDNGHIDRHLNTMPLFLNERVFALSGYQLVEGKVSGAQIEEVRRLRLTPAAP